jgi:exopolysaccharide biosynthesis predicted pyruvyltransferase EpsI/nitroreductase
MHKIFWVGLFPPEVHSVGDHAQTLAVEKFLKTNFSDYEVKRYYRTDVDQFFSENVEPDDLIFLHSGGDFGDLYPDWHAIRKQIINKFSENRIVQLPVSVFYGSIVNFEEDKIFFSGRKNLLILCRTPESAEILSNNFDCRAEFFPDFVFSLKVPVFNSVRRGKLAVMRCDAESIYRKTVPNKLRKGRPLRMVIDFLLDVDAKKRLMKVFADNYYVKDVQVTDYDITDENRERVIYDTLRFYSRFESVITDRFHGAVFSFLTNTPFKFVGGKIKKKTTIDLSLDFDSYFKNFRNLVFSDVPSSPTSEIVASNSLLELIKSRRSTRKWNKKPVEPDTIRQILEAAIYAPTAANLQATRFKVLTDQKDIAFVCQNTSPWFRNILPNKAILVFYDIPKLKVKDWTERFVWQDTACAMQNMMLLSEFLGLKSCWASVNPEQAKRIKAYFKIPQNLVLTCMLFLGYSDVKVSLKSKHQGRSIMRSFKDAVLGDY